MAGAVFAGGSVAAKTASLEADTTDGTEEETDPAAVAGEESDLSLLGLGVLPVSPPPEPVLRAGTVPGDQASAAGGEVRAGQGAVEGGSSVAGQSPASMGQVQPPSGGAPSSRVEAPTAVQHPLAKPDVSAVGKSDPAVGGKSDPAAGGKSDPAVAVHEVARSAEAVAAFALPEGLVPVRESFDSLLPGLSAAPAATPASGAAAAATPAAQAPTQASLPVPLGAVPMTIGLRSLQGSNHFEIRLDPGELGRIDVSLDIDKERGTVMAHLVVDRIETLALLQRDAGSLQQALSQAGLDAPEANISLSLRSDTQSGGQGAEGQGSDGRRSEGRPGGPGLSHQAEGRTALDAVPLRTLRGLTGLDIRI